MMAGFFYGPNPEWNVLVDLFSAAIAYRHLAGNNCSFGLDVTKKCPMTQDEVVEAFIGQSLGTYWS
jgi:inosine-uridine nucleoside N-ribohydrolase